MTGSIETIRGRETRVDQYDADASAVVARAEAVLAEIGAEIVYGTVALMKADTELVSGNRVRTLGYYASRDRGAAMYDIVTLAAFGSTPDGYGSHLLANGLVAAIRHDGLEIKAEQYGVAENSECSARWQAAFYDAADMVTAAEYPVQFSCKTSFLAKNTLLMADRNGTNCQWLTIDHPGGIKATTGGNLEPSTHSVPVPLVQISAQKSYITFGMIDCNRICSGVLVIEANATKVWKPNIVRFDRYGYFVCNGLIADTGDGRNGNHVLLYPNIKQWEQTDAEFDDPADTQWTGDCLVVGHKDWQAIGGTYGWARTAVLMLDQTIGTGDIDGRTVYAGYKSQGCGDFFLRGAHVMQGRPGGPARVDNRSIGGPINIECWNQTNKAYILDTDWDSGTGQFYGHRVVLEGCSMVAGGQNRKDDRVVLFDPVLRFYARADATQPAGLEIGQNNNLTVGFYPFESNVWTGDYTAINYDNRQKSTGYTGAVTYVAEWNAETATVFPTSTTAGQFWLVRTNTSGGTVTFAGQSFTDGDLLTAIVNGASTSTYAGNWWVSGNNQVEMLLRGVQGRANAGERYVQATSAGVPILAYYSPANELKLAYDVAGAQATESWDGTTWSFAANNIAVKNWTFASGGDINPGTSGALNIGGNANRVLSVFATQINLKGTVANGLTMFGGSGSPEGVVTAGKGCIYLRDDGGASTSFYVKESGSGNTGWVAK